MRWLWGILSGGEKAGFRRSLRKLEAAVDKPDVWTSRPQAAARLYAKTIMRGCCAETERALQLFHDYDARIPDDSHAGAFGPGAARWISKTANTNDTHLLQLLFELAVRLKLKNEIRTTAKQRSVSLAKQPDRESLLSHLDTCRKLGIVDHEFLTETLSHLASACDITQDSALRWLLGEFPDDAIPDMFEVHVLLDRPDDVRRMAKSAAQQRATIEYVLRRPADEQLAHAVSLAESTGEETLRARSHAAYGEFLLGQRRFEDAFHHFEAARLPEKMSLCYEALGDFFAALDACPLEDENRIIKLVAGCQERVDEAVKNQQFQDAIDRTGALQSKLASLRGESDEKTACVRSLEAQRHAILLAARKWFREEIEASESDGHNELLLRWSAFEESAGEFAAAAWRAEKADDFYRAHQLFRKAGQYGDAVRVVTRLDPTPESLLELAQTREEGNDFRGAAKLYEQMGQWRQASECHERGGDFATAAKCMRQWMSDEEAAESAHYMTVALKADEPVELLNLYCAVIGEKGKATAAVQHLHQLVSSDYASLIPADLLANANTLLESQQRWDRRQLEARFTEFLAKAHDVINGRYSKAWGMDLGTTNSCLAIYDKQAKRPVICNWKGSEQFRSTWAVGRDGEEHVGLSREELLLPGFLGHVTDAKRKLGTHHRYQVAGKMLRPEEVSARIVAHGRHVVEAFLREQIKAEIARMCEAEIGNVPLEWIDEELQKTDIASDQLSAVLTIPAYFRNNQKHGTRDTCEIAGIDVKRLIHEPTAACLAADRIRELTGNVVVVDLGAGTLDIAFVTVTKEGDGSVLHEVKQVLGNNQFGSRDFDAAILAYLKEKIKQATGFRLDNDALLEQRLDVAAEWLKIELSSATTSSYPLPAFGRAGDVTVELSRKELETILADHMATLNHTCQEFRSELTETPQHLLLVGGPMHSPLVRERVENVFKVNSIVMDDPRTLVAKGAAWQAAILMGDVRESLLIDVTPLSLGIKVRSDHSKDTEFSLLIESNTTIPVEKRGNYTTTEDNQTSVDIEVFQENLEQESKLGHFRLEGISPAEAGTPKIEVVFEIDANCVLHVTARDQVSGRSMSTSITDSTLISPSEKQRMVTVAQSEHERKRAMRELQIATAALSRRIEEAETEWQATDVHELLQRRDQHQDTIQQCYEDMEPAMQAIVLDMFQGAGEVANALSASDALLGDLLANAKKLVGKREAGDPTPTATNDIRREIEQVNHLAAEIDKQLQAVAPLRERIDRWKVVINRAITEAVTKDPDPVRRFVWLHDAEAFAKATVCFAEIEDERIGAAQVCRYLDCLANNPECDEKAYAKCFMDNVGQLNVVSGGSSKLADFCAAARPSIAWLHVNHGSSRLASGSGFLIAPDLVVTNRHVLQQPGALADQIAGREEIQVHLDGVWRSVSSVRLPASTSVDLALVRLESPASARPFRIGYSHLLSLADKITAMGFPLPDASRSADENLEIHSGLVNRFEIDEGTQLRMFKVDLQAHQGMSGGPVFNDLGEVVGVITLKKIYELGREVVSSSWALPVDTIRSMVDPPWVE